MKLAEAIAILEAHNIWRRHDAHLPEDAAPPMGDPRQIGIAIDTVCDIAPALLRALHGLHDLCSAMDLEREAERPSEDEYAAVMEIVRATISDATEAA